MKVTGEYARIVRDRMEKALKAEFGDEIIADLGNIRYGGNEVRFTGLTMKFKSEDETDEDAARQAWDRACYREGLLPEDFGKVFEYNFKKVRIDEIHSRRKKYSIGATVLPSGEKILLDRKAVARKLGRTVL